MRKLGKIELKQILENHKKWLETDGIEGERANLRNADLSYADLRNADLSNADLRNADLSNADLRNADLSYADLSYADLRNADLSNADLRCADFDFSTFPLWCGGLDLHIDDRQAIQLLYHLVRNVHYSKNTSEELKNLLNDEKLIKKANEFHRVNECWELKK